MSKRNVNRPNQLKQKISLPTICSLFITLFITLFTNCHEKGYNSNSQGNAEASEIYLDMAIPEEAPRFNTEEYDRIYENDFVAVWDNPLSTFSIDVDNASYSNVRRFLTQYHELPPPDAVRIEELINYFSYDYPQPRGEHPFALVTEVAQCPWNPEHQLLHLGIQGKSLDYEQLSPSNLVFLVDVSGSMDEPNKLPLVQKSLRLIGYENRILAREDFDNDQKDAGELGAGHTVTALYEIIPTPPDQEVSTATALRYQQSIVTDQANADELLTFKLRYKPIGSKQSLLIEQPVRYSENTFDESSQNFRLSATIAGFGLLLRKSKYSGTLTFDRLESWLHGAQPMVNTDWQDFEQLIQTQTASLLSNQ